MGCVVGDGWTGYRDGPFRGHHLARCPKHRTIWHPEQDACPVCALEAENARLRRELAAAGGWKLQKSEL